MGLIDFPSNITCTTIITDDGPTLGLRSSRGIIDVAKAEAYLRQGLPPTVEALLCQQGDQDALRRLIDSDGATLPADCIIAEESAHFGPCVSAPGKIICLGLNYVAHAAEGNMPPPTTPVLFNKFATSLNAHRGTIEVSGLPDSLWDYEAELVIVMGHKTRNVSQADARRHIFGYCVGQDFSARDLQVASSQWMLGKAGDGWGPIGPWIVSADQVDVDNLDIMMFVNGELRQSSNTRHMIFNTASIVSYLSRYMTLEPGDLIFTGTPEGVIAGMPPDKQAWLKPGDRLVTSIEKLGDQEILLV